MVQQEQVRVRTITSRQNSMVNELSKGVEQGKPTGQGYIAIEVVRIIEEAIRSGLRFQTVFFSAQGRDHSARLLPQLANLVEALLLPDAVFASPVTPESLFFFKGQGTPKDPHFSPPRPSSD